MNESAKNENLESDEGVGRVDDFLDEREGAVVELHAESGQSSQGKLDVQKLENHWLIMTENLAGCDHVDLQSSFKTLNVQHNSVNLISFF